MRPPSSTKSRSSKIAGRRDENAPSIALFERFGYVEAARLTAVGRKFERWRTQLLLLKGF
jgi:L-amino acid N-acyltransferase YncA